MKINKEFYMYSYYQLISNGMKFDIFLNLV